MQKLNLNKTNKQTSWDLREKGTESDTFSAHSKKAGEHRLKVKSNLRTLAEVFLPRCGQCKAPEGNSGNTDFAKK